MWQMTQNYINGREVKLTVSGRSSNAKGWEAVQSHSGKLLGCKCTFKGHGSTRYRPTKKATVFYIADSYNICFLFRCHSSGPFNCSCNVQLLGRFTATQNKMDVTKLQR